MGQNEAELLVQVPHPGTPSMWLLEVSFPNVFCRELFLSTFTAGFLSTRTNNNNSNNDDDHNMACQELTFNIISKTTIWKDSIFYNCISVTFKKRQNCGDLFLLRFISMY